METFLQRLTDMEPELVEGGSSAFDDEAFEDVDLEGANEGDLEP